MTGLSRLHYVYNPHSEEVPGEKHSFGGGLAYGAFSLRLLYEEYQRGHNWWTRSNFDLDLCRYRKTLLRLYRDPEHSYIFSFSREVNVPLNALTHMSCHPAVQLLSRHHVIVASQRERPGRRRWVRVAIKPPRMMQNHWYFTQDFCPVNLFTYKASWIDLQWPWIDPSQVSPCVHFKVVQRYYYDNIKNLADENSVSAREKLMEKILSTEKGTQSGWTPLCEAQVHCATIPVRDNWPNLRASATVSAAFNVNDLCDKTKWKDNSPYNSFKKNAEDAAKQHVKDYQAITNIKIQDSDVDKTLHYKYGLWSYLYLTSRRLDPQLPGPYTKVGYNPHTDSGKGNMIFCNSCSNGTYAYSERSSKCLIKDQPLWLSLFGYVDWLTKYTNDKHCTFNYYLVVRSPYTYPKLQRSEDPNQGEVPLGEHFCEGNMPNGEWPISVEWRFKWYPCVAQQMGFIETIVNSGPWVPRNYKNKSMQVTLGYSSKWLWGGNRMVTRPLQDPCSAGRRQLPDPDPRLKPIQVVDPGRQVPELTFHTWDLRRGQITAPAIHRVQEYSEDDRNLSSGPPTRPWSDLVPGPAEGPGSPRGSSRLGRKRSFTSSDGETETEEEPEQKLLRLQQLEQQHPVEQYLLRELQKQKALQKALSHKTEVLLERLVRAEGGFQLDPRLLP